MPCKASAVRSCSQQLSPSWFRHSRSENAGKALAIFFGIAGGLTAIGPVLGGYLTEWTWRAIFWVNIPVAIIALVLTWIAKPTTVHKPAKMDYRGLVLVALGVGLSVFGFQQSTIWGWSNPGIGLSHRSRACHPRRVRLRRVPHRIATHPGEDLPDPGVHGPEPGSRVAMLVFVPVFFFGSEYAQIALAKSANEAGVILLFFFIGFFVTAQIGGRMLDRRGAKPPVVMGCALAAVGFYLWAENVTKLSFGSVQWPIILSGAGIGFMLGPSSTDAVNRASKLSYGEATGITQTIRNYSASLGLAILGTILVSQFRSELITSFVARGVPHRVASS